MPPSQGGCGVGLFCDWAGGLGRGLWLPCGFSSPPPASTFLHLFALHTTLLISLAPHSSLLLCVVPLVFFFFLILAGYAHQLDAKYNVQQRVGAALDKAAALDARLTHGVGASAVSWTLAAATSALSYVLGEVEAQRALVAATAATGACKAQPAPLPSESSPSTVHVGAAPALHHPVLPAPAPTVLPAAPALPLYPVSPASPVPSFLSVLPAPGAPTGAPQADAAAPPVPAAAALPAPVPAPAPGRKLRTSSGMAHGLCSSTIS